MFHHAPAFLHGQAFSAAHGNKVESTEPCGIMGWLRFKKDGDYCPCPKPGDAKELTVDVNGFLSICAKSGAVNSCGLALMHDENGTRRDLNSRS